MLFIHTYGRLTAWRNPCLYIKMSVNLSEPTCSRLFMFLNRYLNSFILYELSLTGFLDADAATRQFLVGSPA